MRRLRPMRLLESLLFVPLVSCQALTDPGVDYVDCFPSDDGKLAETFDDADNQPERDRCWKTDNLVTPARVHEFDSDLIIHPNGTVGASWSESSQAPFFFQTLTGDFLVVARAEAVSTIPKGDHCLAPSEATGLVVRRRVPFAWTALLVRPDLSEDELLLQERCGDNPLTETFAKVTVETSGLEGGVTGEVQGVGADAEADIALCRADDQLYFYHQDAATRGQDPDEPPNLKLAFSALEVGYGPLDVGLSATAQAGARTSPEGHFDWIVLEDYASGPRPSDGCLGALESFSYPEPE